MNRHLALTSTQKYLIGLGILALLSMACAVPPSQPIDSWRPAQLGGGSPLATPEMLPIETATTQIVVDATLPATTEIATITAEPTAVLVQMATVTPSETPTITETLPISGNEWVTLTVNGFLSATQHFTGSKLVVTGVNTATTRFTTVRFDSAVPPTDTNRMTVDVVGTAFYTTMSNTLATPFAISTTVTGTQFCQESVGLIFMAMFPLMAAPVAFVFDDSMTVTAQWIDRVDLVGIPTNHYRLAPISYTVVVSDNLANLGMNFGETLNARAITVSIPSGEIWVSDTGDLVRIELTDVWTSENSDLIKSKARWTKLAAGLNDNGAEWVQLPEICKNPIQDNTIFAL